MNREVGPTAAADDAPVPFFEWLSALACHLELRKDQHRDHLWRVALLVGKTCSGNSGRDVWLDETTVTAQLRISRSTFYVHRDRLVSDGWLVQTHKPTRPARGAPKGSKGKVARYQLALPERVRVLRATPGHVHPEIASEIDALTSDTINSDRVRERDRWCPRTDLIVSEHHAQTSDGYSLEVFLQSSSAGSLPTSSSARAPEDEDEAPEPEQSPLADDYDPWPLAAASEVVAAHVADARARIRAADPTTREENTR